MSDQQALRAAVLAGALDARKVGGPVAVPPPLEWATCPVCRWAIVIEAGWLVPHHDRRFTKDPPVCAGSGMTP